MKKFDPLVALARQQRLAAAAREAVDASLHPFTSVDASLPVSRSYKTNPISAATAPARVIDRAAERSSAPRDGRDGVGSSPSLVSRGVDGRLPPLTSVDRGLPNSDARKTNPIRADATTQPATTLSPRQLAAARLLARGRPVADVAAELRITRQALWKWRRLPAFVAELGCLHELLARQPDVTRRELNYGERR